MTLVNKLMRGIWYLVELLLFRPTPRPFYAWRAMLLRLFGAKLGAGARIYPDCRVWAPWNLSAGSNCCLGPGVEVYNVAPIKIGNNVTVSHQAMLCTASRDIRSKELDLIVGKIEIADQAWIAARVFVGPGLRVGEGAVAGANATITKDMSPWTVYLGNPAKKKGSRKIRKSSL